jgi:hypothetical protein
MAQGCGNHDEPGTSRIPSPLHDEVLCNVRCAGQGHGQEERSTESSISELAGFDGCLPTCTSVVSQLVPLGAPDALIGPTFSSTLDLLASDRD